MSAARLPCPARLHGLFRSGPVLALALLVGACATATRQPAGAEAPRLVPQLGHSSHVSSVAFSPGGERVLTGSADNTAVLWDAASGAELQRFAHGSYVESVAFSPGGDRVLTGSGDGTAVLWNAETGRELARLTSFEDDSWAVIAPDGRYDASNGGRIEHLHWVLGGEALPLERFRERYYTPELLGAVYGGGGR